MHKVGKFTITSGGAPAKVYLQAAHDYGAKVDPVQVNRARKGQLNWFVPKDSEGVTYQVNVPKTYVAGEPYGVLVVINAGESGRLPQKYEQLLDKHRLIAIGADKSGNKAELLFRHSYAVHAVELLNERYDLDRDRIYVTGGSGGGRITSQVMIINSDTFTGGIPMIGANACISMQVADSAGRMGTDPGAWRNKDKKRLAKAGREGRYVFMTGSKDYNKANVKSVYAGYQKAKFRYVHYIEEGGLGHSAPSVENFEKALQFLDTPLTKAATKYYGDALKKHASGKLDDALLLFRQAAVHGHNTQWYADAVAKTEEIQVAYEKAYAEVEAAIESEDNAAFRKALQDLRRNWSGIADRDVLKELNDRFKQAQ